MKKMLFILLAVITTATTFAQQPTTAPAYLWRDGSKIYQGQERLTQREYRNLLQNTCPEAFAQYRKGKVMANWGWGVLGAGAFSMAMSWIPLCPRNPYSSTMESGEYYEHMHFNSAKTTGWASMMIVGALVMTSSVPIICVGYAKRDKSLGIYNLQCRKQEPVVTYSLTAGQNGLGIAVNF